MARNLKDGVMKTVEPDNIWRTRLAVMLHNRGLTNAEIARRVNIKHQASVYWLVKRWKTWVEQHPIGSEIRKIHA